MPFELRFDSELEAAPERVWEWMTSARGISTEMAPFLRMTFPRHLSRLSDLDVTLGARLFRSWVLLFGVLPIDRWDFTLIELSTGTGFVEQSPAHSMRLWRHQRTLSARDGVTVLTDRLTFEPRVARRLSRWLIQTVFTHRHRVLRRHFGTR